MNNTPLTPEEILEIHHTNPEAVFRLQPNPNNPEGYQTKLRIKEGSGMVGRPASGGFCIYFEGNLYDACNLRTLEEREHCAAGRLKERYPTVARTYLPTLEETLKVFTVTVYQEPVRETPIRGFQRGR